VSFLGDVLRTAGGALGGFITGGPAGAVLGGLAGSGLVGGGSPRKPVAQQPIGSPWPQQTNYPGTGDPGMGVDLPGLPRISIGEQTTPGGLNLPGSGPPGFGYGPVQIGGAAPGAATSTLPFVGAIGINPQWEKRSVATVPEKYRRRGVRYVLAGDGLFYPRQMVPKQYRKWKPDPKPPITVRDNRAIIRADAARKRVKLVARKAGLHVHTRAQHSAPKRGRK
jgi:hypothetical protein